MRRRSRRPVRRRRIKKALPPTGPLVPGTDFGAYHVYKLIGSGGFADVYLAVHKTLRRRSALKVIRAEMLTTPKVSDQFLREARLVAQFDHPNVVDIYDAGRGEGDRLFMSMRFVPGGSLSGLIAREGALPESKALSLMQDCCAGLKAIHDIGLVHRDIKLANILIERDGRTRIADLGLACLHSENHNDGKIRGTPLYMAPEIIRGRETATAKTDLYALGITFTAMLTGAPPLASLKLSEVARRTAAGQLPDPQDTLPEMSDNIADLLRDLTARDPEDRPADTTEVLSRVTEILERTQGKLPYASPLGRENGKTVAAISSRLKKDPIVRAILESHPGPALVLNRYRQVVTANNTTDRMLGGQGLANILGDRPGEVLKCENVPQGPDGCGTSPSCRFCPLGRALSDAQQQADTPLEGECRISADRGSAYEFNYRLSELPLKPEPMHLVTLQDASAEKRRRAVGKGLVANLMDTAAAVRLAAEYAAETARSDAVEESVARLTSGLSEASTALYEEAIFHHHLLAAEEGEFTPLWEEIDVRGLLDALVDGQRRQPTAEGREIVLDCPDELYLVTDPMLLRRTVQLLVRNAVEACPVGSTVTVRLRPLDASGIRIDIHSPETMPLEVQAQVFKPSFSTKSSTGRGMGTYAARLFAEKYLEGKIRFTSRAPDGTTFQFDVPSRD